MPKIIQTQDKRREFIDTLCELAEKDDRIVLLVPDVGFNYTDGFEQRFPDRYFNVGVCEQSMVMIAVGMAKMGLRPYCYSMINFVLFRPYEMVRNGVVGHDVPITLLGVKGSSGYKFLGFSHNLRYEDEDVDACDSMGLAAYRPETNEEVRQILELTYKSNKPAYIRL